MSVRGFLVREFGPAREHRIESVRMPPLQPHEVLIRTRAAGVNYPDLLVMEGKYQVRPPLPFVPGRDAAGTVEQIGESVKNVRVGDNVMCQISHGAWSERAVAAAIDCDPMPPSASFVDAAAMLTPPNTAYVALLGRAQIRPGEVVVVTGASGSVGVACIQIAVAVGAVPVAIVSNESKVDYVKSMGAAACIVANASPDLKKTLRESLLKATDGREADVVIDMVGGELFAAGLRLLRVGGRMVVVGFLSSIIPELKVNYLLLRNLAVLGAPVDINFRTDPALRAAAIRFIHTQYELKSLRPTIKAALPFDRLPDALARAADFAEPGRVVVTF